MDEWEKKTRENFLTTSGPAFCHFWTFRNASQPLELALRLSGDHAEQAALEARLACTGAGRSRPRHGTTSATFRTHG